MKTPDEIKRAMQACTDRGASYEKCPYYQGNGRCDARAMLLAAYRYMEQLEKENAQLMLDAKRMGGCLLCKYRALDYEAERCRDCGILLKNYEWRGVPEKENAHGETDSRQAGAKAD